MQGYEYSKACFELPLGWATTWHTQFLRTLNFETLVNFQPKWQQCFLMKSGGIGMLYYLCSKEKSSFNLDLQSMVGKGHRRDSLNLIHWKFVCCVILSYASGDYLAVRYSKRDPRRNLSLQSPRGISVSAWICRGSGSSSSRPSWAHNNTF